MATASMQPELKGVVIISLPPPDNPNEGKTVCAAFTVRGGGGGGAVQQQQQQRQQQQQQIPNPNPRRPFLSRRRARLRKATAILFVSALALAIWYWTPDSGFDNSPNEDDDDSKVGVYTLYPKYGNNYHGPVEDKPALKLGAFVERDTTRNNVSPATSTSSSTAFTIQGNVYPDGLYYVSMLIGNPPKAYHLDVDTGSDLTWIQCDAPCRSCAKGPHALYKPKKSQLVSCMEPMCVNVQAGHSYECTSTSEQCDYEIEYADLGSSMGVLARDNIRVLLTNGSIARTNFVFGCAYDQQGSLAVSPAVTDGVLGLSSAQVSLPSQLASQGLTKNVIGHCIAGDERDERGGGYMFFGNDLVPVWGMTWVPMLGKPAMKLYYVGNANMKLGNRFWTNLSETTEKINDIEVLDRGFLHGDIVAAASDPSGQTGIVVNVDLKVDLLTSTSATIKYISTKKLQRIRAFAVGDYVIHGPWLGKVDEVVDNVTVVFDDGSKCKLMKADPDRLIPISKNLLEDTHYPYFPGQRVRGSSSTVFKNARWLCGAWKANRMEGTVSNVEVGSVYVYWIAAAHTGYNSQSATIPAEQQDPKRLKLLSCFSYADWKLGDWCLLPASERTMSEVTLPVTDDMEASVENVASSFSVSVGASVSKTETIHAGTPAGIDSLAVQDAGGTIVSAIKRTMHESLDIDIEMLGGSVPLPTSDSQNTTNSCLKETASDSWVTHRKKFRRRVIKRDKRLHKKDEVLDEALFVGNKQTKVDVIWQDGARTCSVDSRTLIPIDNRGDYDFFPGQYVLEKVSDDDGEASNSGRIGVVKTVDSKERTARVTWLKPVDCPDDAHKFDGEEVVSVYELAEHPDYNYFIGDIVIRLSPISEATEVPGIGNQLVGQIECRDETRPNNVVETTVLSKNQKALKKRQKAELDESLDESNLSWIGNIIGLKDGDIEVAWADGMVSKVGPQAIFVVGRDEDDASIQSNVEEDGEDDAASWETVDPDAVYALEMDEQHEQLEQVRDHTDLQTAPDGDHDLADQKNVIQEHIDLQTGADSSRDLADLKNEVQPKEIICQQNEGSLSIPQAAFGFVARIASGLHQFRRSRSMSDASNLSYQECASQKDNFEEMLDRNETGNIQKEEMAIDSQDHLSDPNTGTQAGSNVSGDTIVIPTKDADKEMQNDSECMDGRDGEHNISLQGGIESPTGADLVESTSGKIDMEQIEEEVIVPSLSNSTCHDPGHFKHFDSVRDSVGHYYLNETGQPINERKWMKKIQQEWNILEKNLPDTIYVRIYEDRMDLLRAVIVGAAGTPYQDGLFFFDIHFPSEYPDVPPLAYYHSGGLRLNPNLYETGKVCLSLLNTWTGRGNEVWDPTSSSILQVLVSIQGLVLNSKPYFNEAGYDKQIGSAEGEKNSLAYSENSFLLSCKSMLYILRRPPKHFEMFVKEHFKKRGHYILRACDAYMKGAQVGSLSEDCMLPSNAGTVSENQNPSSAGFKLMLRKIIPKLISALSETGVECQEFQQSIPKESEVLCGL